MNLRPLRFLALLLALPITLKAQTVYAVVMGNPSQGVVGSSTLGSGLFASTDAGASWRHMGSENLKAYRMDAIDSAQGRVLFVAAGDGIHRSDDGGARWRIVTPPEMTEVLDVTVDQADPRWIYAATQFGFYRSTDGGHSWEHPDGPLATRYVYSIDELEFPGAVYASTDDGVYESLDYGSTWTHRLQLSEPRGVTSIRGSTPVVATGNGPVMLDATMNTMVSQPTAPMMNTYAVKFDPSGRIFASGDHGVWVYSLVGAWTRWIDITTDLPDSVVHALAYVPKSNVVLAGTWGHGVFRRDNDTWVASGLDGALVWSMKVEPW